MSDEIEQSMEPRDRGESVVATMVNFRKWNNTRAEPSKRISSFVNPLYHQMPGEEVKAEKALTCAENPRTPANSTSDEQRLSINSIDGSETPKLCGFKIHKDSSKIMHKDSKKIIYKKYLDEKKEKTNSTLIDVEHEDKLLKEKLNQARGLSIDECKKKVIDTTTKKRISSSNSKTVTFFDEQNQALKIKQRLTIKSFDESETLDEVNQQQSTELIRSRELKWSDMLKDLAGFRQKHYQKLKARCRKGIPVSVRFQAWQNLTDSVAKKTANPNYFEECLFNLNKFDLSEFHEKMKIDLDEINLSKETKSSMITILKAFAVHAKLSQYSEQYRYITNVLVTLMFDIDSFFILTRLHQMYLKEYYLNDRVKIEADAKLLAFLLKKECKNVFEMLSEVGFDFSLFIEDWFMSLFAACLPIYSVLRVWDMFFCEGFKVLFRLAVYLIKSALDNRDVIESCRRHGSDKVCEYLRSVDSECFKCENLVKGLLEIEIFTGDLNEKKSFKRKSRI